MLDDRKMIYGSGSGSTPLTYGSSGSGSGFGSGTPKRTARGLAVRGRTPKLSLSGSCIQLTEARGSGGGSDVALGVFYCLDVTRVADPRHFNADRVPNPDLAFHFNADPNSLILLMGICVQWSIHVDPSRAPFLSL